MRTWGIWHLLEGYIFQEEHLGLRWEEALSWNSNWDKENGRGELSCLHEDGKWAGGTNKEHLVEDAAVQQINLRAVQCSAVWDGQDSDCPSELCAEVFRLVATRLQTKITLYCRRCGEGEQRGIR